VHVPEVIVAGGIIAVAGFAVFGVNSWKHGNLDDMSEPDVGIDWPLTQIARIMKHLSPPSLSVGERVAIVADDQTACTANKRPPTLSSLTPFSGKGKPCSTDISAAAEPGPATAQQPRGAARRSPEGG
jgi:hypothetical protein